MQKSDALYRVLCVGAEFMVPAQNEGINPSTR